MANTYQIAHLPKLYIYSRWLVALWLSVAFVYHFAKRGRLALTDESIRKAIFWLCTPFAWVDCRLLELRIYAANFLTFSAQSLAV